VHDAVDGQSLLSVFGHLPVQRAEPHAPQGRKRVAQGKRREAPGSDSATTRDGIWIT